jgi:hypothetical protein
VDSNDRYLREVRADHILHKADHSIASFDKNSGPRYSGGGENENGFAPILMMPQVCSKSASQCEENTDGFWALPKKEVVEEELPPLPNKKGAGFPAPLIDR